MDIYQLGVIVSTILIGFLRNLRVDVMSFKIYRAGHLPNQNRAGAYVNLLAVCVMCSSKHESRE